MSLTLTRRAAVAGLLSVAGSGAVAGGYAYAVEPHLAPRTTRYAVRPRSWTTGPRVRIAALADIHAGGDLMNHERVAAIVEQANALGADLITLLGDYNGSGSGRRVQLPWDDLARLLAGLKAPLGVYAIQGNHEYWDDPAFRGGIERQTAMSRALERHGVPVLDNVARRIDAPTGAFWLAGVASQVGVIGRRHGMRRGLYGLDDLPRALAQVTGDEPVVLLAHEPDMFASLPARVSLQLSGHTHGGQLRFFGWSPIVPSQYGNRYAYGHVEENDRHLIVSGGIGTVSGGVAPVRFGVPPEIVLVDIG